MVPPPDLQSDASALSKATASVWSSALDRSSALISTDTSSLILRGLSPTRINRDCCIFLARALFRCQRTRERGQRKQRRALDIADLFLFCDAMPCLKPCAIQGAPMHNGREGAATML